MISNKNVGLVALWKTPCYPSFITSLQPNITCLLKFLKTKLLFLSREKSDFKVEQALFQKGIGTGIQSGSKFISKLGSYFKVGQKFFKVGQLFQSGQLFQNGT